MSDPNYDGLCGIPLPHRLKDGNYIRCKLSIGHHGSCDWEKYKKNFYIQSHCNKMSEDEIMYLLATGQIGTLKKEN